MEEKCIAEYDLNIPIDIMQATVRDLINIEGSWNWQLMEYWIPPNFKLCINATLPLMVENAEDKFMINNEEDGSFSVKNMYVKLMQEGVVDGNNIWNHIWSMKVPKRVRSFIWTLMHDMLPTNFRVSMWGLGSASCSLCDNICESSLHLLCDYNFACRVWDNKVPNNIKQAIFGTNLQDWMHLNILANPYENTEWCIYWATCCHLLWTWRNRENHSVEFQIPLNCIANIENNLHYYRKVMQISHRTMDTRKFNVLVKWSPLVDGVLKLNTDGSRDKDGLAGCGGVI